MRAPRRTPYERSGALDHLYTSLYPGDQCDIINDESYRQSRNQGLSIVHLWLNRSACPHAVESTGSLIHAQELDEQLVILPSLQLPTRRPSGSASRSGSSSEWAVRCAYSTAILRFVNSVVDTFQTAMFAKSIFHISQRIGLPAYLVELRHAATHEELPSLVVLRDACRESLLWLQRNFWWPTLARQQSATSVKMASATNGSSSLLAIDPMPLQRDAATQLRSHLARYRKISKRIIRDESLRGRYKNALSAAQSKVEACAKKYEADFSQTRGMAAQNEGWEEEQIDGSGAALLVDMLLEPGGLIPLSKRKRPRSIKGNGTDIVELPSQLLQVWLPLLNHLSATIDGFSDALQEGLIACLVHSSSSLEKSYLDTAASWLVALYGDDKPVLAAPKLVSRQSRFSSDDVSEDERGLEEQEKPTLVLARRCLTGPTEMTLAVARMLCAKDERLTERVKPLFDMAEASLLGRDDILKSGGLETGAEEMVTRTGEDASELEMSVLEMERRLEALQGKPLASQETLPLNPPRAASKSTEQEDEQVKVCSLLAGWHCAPTDWTPTPIGCLNGKVPHLVLTDI